MISNNDSDKAQGHEKEEMRHAWGMSFMRFGLIGLTMIIPALIGAILGMWLDMNHPGAYPWTILLIISGLVIGFLISWSWLQREIRHSRRL